MNKKRVLAVLPCCVLQAARLVETVYAGACAREDGRCVNCDIEDYQAFGRVGPRRTHTLSRYWIS